MFFTDSLNARTNKARNADASELLRFDYPIVDRKFISDIALFHLPVGSEVILDCEVYRNYFLAAFKHVATNSYFYEETGDLGTLNIERLQWIMWHFKLITYNGRTYDLPIVDKAMREGLPGPVKDYSDEIINGGEYRTSKFNYNHIDLIEVTPLSASLKTYAGRMHAPYMQDLPINPDKELTSDEMEQTRHYCFNDLDNTHLLYSELLPDIVLREQLGKDYKQDLRSRSDAQLAEAVIVSEIQRLTGVRPQKPKVKITSFKYQVPDHIYFQTEQLKSMLEKVRKATFIVGDNGYAIMPAELDELCIRIGNCDYRMGMGGLHSSEKSISHYATDNILLIDRDVASYYPMIMINQKLFPKHLGGVFLEVFGLGNGLVGRRLIAKKNKTTIQVGLIIVKTADGLKIVVNGTFGKLGDPYSVINAPDLCMQVTISGQLYLLMLIEALELVGIPVVSANTDGIVIACPHNRYDELNAIVAAWERHTSFETEETRYSSLHCRDVNNYIAIKTDGEVKAKGIYAEKGSQRNSRLSKNPETLICSDAVKAYLSKGIQIETTIKGCNTTARFVSVRNVVGGGRFGNYYLGKVVRWYYSKNVNDALYYCKSGNKVPKSYGAMPCMVMPTELPTDIDYDWYINEANAMLYDIGALSRPAQGVFAFEA